MSYAHQKGLSRIEVLVTILVTLVILAIFVPPRRSPWNYNESRIEALNNAKALAGGLVAFKTEMGHYPCDATREELEKEGYANLRKDSDANAYLAQLVVIDIIDDEGFFYASGMKGAIKGDNIKGTSDKILSVGENGFAYIMTTGGRPLSDATSKTPLVLAHLETAGPVPTFDPKPFNGKGVSGLVDGSGALFTINKKGHAVTEDGVELFATGSGSLFGKETPVVKAPTQP